MSAIDGIVSTTVRKRRSVMTSRSTGDVAVTVAVRGLSVMRAISPSQSPGPRSATLRPFFVTFAVPADEDEELPSGLAFAREDGALAHVELVRGLRELPQLALRALGEERDLLQELDLRVAAERHGTIIRSEPGRIEGRWTSSDLELGMYRMTCPKSRIPRPCVWGLAAGLGKLRMEERA